MGSSYGPSSPRSISTTGNTLVEPDTQRSPSITPKCQIRPAFCNKSIDWDNEKDSVYDPGETCHGWPELTKEICERPDFEAFQSFKDLHIKSLLYYQVELAGIRETLRIQEWTDHRQNPFEDAHTLCSRADTLLLCDRDGKPQEERAQIDQVRRMRVVLKEYSDALLQYSRINELPPADHFNVNTLNYWLRKPRNKNGGCHIGGPGSDSWGKLEDSLPRAKLPGPGQRLKHMLRSLTIFWAEEPKKTLYDLVVPGKKRDVDGFTRWVTYEWIPFWHSLRGLFVHKPPRRDPESHPESANKDGELRRHSNASSALNLVQKISRLGRKPSSEGPAENGAPKDADKERSRLITYRIGRIRTFTSFVTTIVACLLPTAAIAILATMHSTAEVIGFIGLFTALFATVLMVLTKAERTAIFSATATFSAVLVVFVQNQNAAPGASN